MPWLLLLFMAMVLSSTARPLAVQRSPSRTSSSCLFFRTGLLCWRFSDSRSHSDSVGRWKLVEPATRLALIALLIFSKRFPQSKHRTHQPNQSTNHPPTHPPHSCCCFWHKDVENKTKLARSLFRTLAVCLGYCEWMRRRALEKDGWKGATAEKEERKGSGKCGKKMH